MLCSQSTLQKYRVLKLIHIFQGSHNPLPIRNSQRIFQLYHLSLTKTLSISSKICKSHLKFLQAQPPIQVALSPPLSGSKMVYHVTKPQLNSSKTAPLSLKDQG